MKHTVILSLCFLPLAIIYIITKISLWISNSILEIKYIKDDAKRSHELYVENPYEDIDKKNEKY